MKEVQSFPPGVLFGVMNTLIASPTSLPGDDLREALLRQLCRGAMGIHHLPGNRGS